METPLLNGYYSYCITACKLGGFPCPSARPRRNPLFVGALRNRPFCVNSRNRRWFSRNRRSDDAARGKIKGLDRWTQSPVKVQNNYASRLGFQSEVLGLVTDCVRKIVRTLSATNPRTSDWKPSHDWTLNWHLVQCGKWHLIAEGGMDRGLEGRWKGFN